MARLKSRKRALPSPTSLESGAETKVPRVASRSSTRASPKTTLTAAPPSSVPAVAHPFGDTTSAIETLPNELLLILVGYLRVKERFTTIPALSHRFHRLSAGLDVVVFVTLCVSQDGSCKNVLPHSPDFFDDGVVVHERSTWKPLETPLIREMTCCQDLRLHGWPIVEAALSRFVGFQAHVFTEDTALGPDLLSRLNKYLAQQLYKGDTPSAQSPGHGVFRRPVVIALEWFQVSESIWWHSGSDADSVEQSQLREHLVQEQVLRTIEAAKPRAIHCWESMMPRIPAPLNLTGLSISMARDGRNAHPFPALGRFENLESLVLQTGSSFPRLQHVAQVLVQLPRLTNLELMGFINPLESESGQASEFARVVSRLLRLKRIRVRLEGNARTSAAALWLNNLPCLVDFGEFHDPPDSFWASLQHVSSDPHGRGHPLKRLRLSFGDSVDLGVSVKHLAGRFPHLEGLELDLLDIDHPANQYDLEGFMAAVKESLPNLKHILVLPTDRYVTIWEDLRQSFAEVQGVFEIQGW